MTLEERAREIQDKLPSLLKWRQRNDMIMAALEATRREAIEETIHSAWFDVPETELDDAVASARTKFLDALRARLNAPRQEGETL